MNDRYLNTEDFLPCSDLLEDNGFPEVAEFLRDHARESQREEVFLRVLMNLRDAGIVIPDTETPSNYDELMDFLDDLSKALKASVSLRAVTMMTR